MKKTVEIRDGDKFARLDPYFGFKLKFSINFRHPIIDKTGQELDVDFANTRLVRARDRACAHTFGFVHEAEMLREIGLARGSSMDNAIMLDEYRILSNDGLRYGDEFVKYKMLDAIGGRRSARDRPHPLLASYIAYKSDHGLNNGFLLEREDAYEIVMFDDP